MWEWNLNVLSSFFFFFQNRNVVNTLNLEKKKKGGWVVFKCGIESGIFLNST